MLQRERLARGISPLLAGHGQFVSPAFSDESLVEENWEEEADRLYEWTQELSFDDTIMATPRLNNTALTVQSSLQY